MKNESNRISINVDKPNHCPLWTYKQEDDGVLKLALFKNSSILDITGQIVKLGVMRQDKTLIEHAEGMVITKGNELDITMKNSIFKVAGMLECDLELRDADGKMTTASFYLQVKGKILGQAGVESTNELGELDRIKKEYNDMKIETFKSEHERNISEVKRNTSEELRNEYELKRVENEDIRKNNESSRELSESYRIADETIRQKNETIRDFSEIERSLKEAERVDIDKKRIDAFDNIKDEYSTLKRVIIDENNAADLQNQISNIKKGIDVDCGNFDDESNDELFDGGEF